MTDRDLEILCALTSLRAGAPGGSGVTASEVRGRLPIHMAYDTVRRHLTEMSTADLPLVQRRRAGHLWLYRLSSAGVSALERSRVS